MADAAIGAGMRGRSRRPRRVECGRDRSGARPRASRRSRAGQGFARHRHRCGRRSAEGGVRLMLYHLLYPLHTHFAVFNVTRYITFRTAAASLSALVIGLSVGPLMIRKLRDFQIGQVIRQDGPATHRAKAGTPTMGGLLILTSALVPTLLWADLTNPFIWMAVLATAAFGGDRVRRRLPQDRQALASRPAASLQDGVADRCRRGSRRRAADAGEPRAVALQHAADLSVLQAPHPGPRVVLRGVRGRLSRRRDQRGQPDRRPRRSGDQRLRGVGRRLHRARLRIRPTLSSRTISSS